MLRQDIAPVLIMVGFFFVAIVALLIRHQQKMAMIIRQDVNLQPSLDVPRVASELHDLRMLVQDQALAVEQLREEVRRLHDRPAVAERSLIP